MGGGGWRNQGLTSTRQLPSCYPSPGNDENTRKSSRKRSVRDRGVGGSNPLAPTNFLRNYACFSVDVNSEVNSAPKTLTCDL